ncbi:MAG: N-glycosylase/DNA lyase [Archaeoglobaceae archaeon]|nr:N-glycosylase/DNA lyase [Archaeoglobaceae archaeon]MDK2876503.1 N-glycosylase/DNA lyase [Archaeoglobaceae archaeon]
MYSSKTSESTEPKIPEVSDQIREAIRKRLKEFDKLGKEGATRFDFKPFLDLEIEAKLETELAFCIATANSSAKAGLKFQKALEELEISKLDVEELEKLLRSSGVRFHRKKAYYIHHAVEKLQKHKFEFDRDFLVSEFYGLGFKEASHFLRNVGIENVAILDRHILRWLGIEKKCMTRRRYLEAEKRMKEIALAHQLSVAELDLLIWSEKTKMVLK